MVNISLRIYGYIDTFPAMCSISLFSQNDICIYIHYVYVYTYTMLHTYTINVCMWIDSARYMYTYIHICTYVYMYICIHIYIYTRWIGGQQGYHHLTSNTACLADCGLKQQYVTSPLMFWVLILSHTHACLWKHQFWKSRLGPWLLCCNAFLHSAIGVLLMNEDTATLIWTRPSPIFGRHLPL